MTLETSPNNPLAELIVIRHGQTKYTEQFPDLTPEGIAQVQETALSLGDYVAQFKQIFSVSSPAQRALGTSYYFLETIGIDASTYPLKILKPFGIKNFTQYLEFDKRNSTPIYGQMWLTHPDLEKENDLIECRERVFRRSRIALERGIHYVAMKARETQQDTLLVASTHFELAAVPFAALYPELNRFPIERELAPNNGEALIIGVDINRPERLTLNGRNRISHVTFRNGAFQNA
jgi:broad specificity phosphatase PhoE